MAFHAGKLEKRQIETYMVRTEQKGKRLVRLEGSVLVDWLACHCLPAQHLGSVQGNDTHTHTAQIQMYSKKND